MKGRKAVAWPVGAKGASAPSPLAKVATKFISKLQAFKYRMD